VFATCNWTFEHQASMKVVKMSLKILDSAHGLPSAAFAVTFVPILLGILVVGYCADILHRRSRCLNVRAHRRNVPSRSIAWDLSRQLRWLFGNLWIFGSRPSPGPLLISGTVVVRRRPQIWILRRISISIRECGAWLVSTFSNRPESHLADLGLTGRLPKSPDIICSWA
jgi:hypothetical protein